MSTNKTSNQKRGSPIRKIHGRRANEKKAIEGMGPLPLTERIFFIVVIGDYFTKWMEAYAIKNHKGETIAKLLVEEFIGRFGISGIIHTDQGRVYEEHLFRDMCKMIVIEKTRATPGVHKVMA